MKPATKASTTHSLLHPDRIIPNRCPIKGCMFDYKTPGGRGWYLHVGLAANHPNWHPDVTDPELRVKLFRMQFPDFFLHARKSGSYLKVDASAEKVAVAKLELAKLEARFNNLLDSLVEVEQKLKAR